MARIRVPVQELRRYVQVRGEPNGSRLFKPPRVVEGPKNSGLILLPGGHVPTRLVTGQTAMAKEGPLAEVAKGNLERGDYYYWIGMPWDNAPAVQCRGCDISLNSKDARVRHFKLSASVHNFHRPGSPGCSRKIEVTMSYLRADASTCVVCGKVTRNTSWSIPICLSKECYSLWMFGRPFTSSVETKSLPMWSAARKLAEKNGWKMHGL
jgi:hypothetical protein